MNNNKVNSQQYTNLTPQYQSQPFYSMLQPQGVIYVLNNSSELSNLINSVGTFAAFCFSENIVYIKSFYNGNYTISSYKLLPNIEETQSQEENVSTLLKQMEQRMSKIEQMLKKEATLNELL